MTITTWLLNKILSRRRLRALAVELSDQFKFQGRANADVNGKAANFIERHREIISDPLNLLIARHPKAGYLDADDHVYLHNGNRVPVAGPYAYYKEFSDILVLNRGVHEPLEEFCFQTLLTRLATYSDPITMLELGAYWGHYSMWMKSAFAQAQVTLVEPDPVNLASGQHNFALNGYEGQFIKDFVGKGHFSVDAHLQASTRSTLTLLHADIQGFEVEMLRDAGQSLTAKAVDYVFVSTHSNPLHEACLGLLSDYGYCIEVSSDPDSHTTSSDGFILACARDDLRLFKTFAPVGRLELTRLTPSEIQQRLNDIQVS